MSELTRCVIRAAGAVLVVPGLVLAQGKNLSPVDAVVTTTYTLADGRQVSSEGRYYRSADGKIREDSPVGAIITHPERGTVTLLSFAGREAQIFSLSAARRDAATARRGKPETAPRLTPMGETVVDGRTVEKKRIQMPSGGEQEVWTDATLGLVVFSKTTTSNLTIAKSLRKIVVREPDAKVFDVPDGYTVRSRALSDALPEGPPLFPVLPKGGGS